MNMLIVLVYQRFGDVRPDQLLAQPEHADARPAAVAHFPFVVRLVREEGGQQFADHLESDASHESPE